MIRQVQNAQRVARPRTAESPCPQFISRAVAGTAKTTPHPARANPVRRPMSPSPTASPVQTPNHRRTNLQARQIRLTLLAAHQVPRLTPTAAQHIATKAMATCQAS